MPGTNHHLTTQDFPGELALLSNNLAGAEPSEKPDSSTLIRTALESVQECEPPTSVGIFSLLQRDCSDEYAEQFRLLRTQLLLHRSRFNQDEEFRVVCVMSTHRGEGRSFTASNLAAVLADTRDQKVLFIDSDPGSRSLPIGIPDPHGPGFIHALSKPSDWIRTVHRVKGTSLYVMGRGANKENDKLDFQALPYLLDVLREQFEWIIMDGAAFARCPDAPWLTAVTDGTLFVVRENVSSFGAVRESLAGVPPERLVGVVFNEHKSKPKVKVRVRLKVGRN